MKYILCRLIQEYLAGSRATLSRELKEKDSEIQELRQTVTALENKLNELSIQTKQQL
jgi:polyhydroxyalkanoate synthesis regulator phasin